MLKVMTSGRAEIAKERAARFVRDVLGDEERAAAIEEESLQGWAERRNIRVENPFPGKRKGRFKPMPTKSELERRVEELEEELSVYEEREDQLLDVLGVNSEDDEESDEFED